MKTVLLVAAVILFILDALSFFVPVNPTAPYRHPSGRLQAVGLACFAASFGVPG